MAKQTVRTKATSTRAKKSAARGKGAASAAKPKSKPKPSARPAVKRTTKPAAKKAAPARAKQATRASAKPPAKKAARPKAAPTRTAPKAAASKPAASTPSKASLKPPPAPVRKEAAPKPPKRTHFDAKTLAAIAGRLEEQREELSVQLSEIEDTAFNASQSQISGEVGYDEDYADAGTATFERERDLSIANNVQDLLDKINKALSKIGDGTYGLCESCGDPISAERLKALPHVLLCIRCKKAEERR